MRAMTLLWITPLLPDCDDLTDADQDGVPSIFDCDDQNASVFPGAVEVCNGIDDDCDLTVDQGAANAPTWYADADGDGYGLSSQATVACQPPPDTSDREGDCNDADARFHPGADEPCTDPSDYNCDGSVGYADVDQDGSAACEDCDDNDATVHPGATEHCDGVDNDCDGAVDDGAVDHRTWYADTDNDTYGDPSTVQLSCHQPEGYVADNTDCDDTSGAVYPGGFEICDALDRDEDCDGLADDADPSVEPASQAAWYVDADSDGFGQDGPQTLLLCEAPPPGYAPNAADCDDTRADVSPSGAEICDASQTDEDCDGLSDDADPSVAGQATYYADADADGFGDAAASLRSCLTPAGHVTDATDCDDADATTHPGATEYCDDADDDCDGSVDEQAVDRSTWYADIDADGHGDAARSALSCDPPPGYVSSDADCDDTDPEIYPEAVDICGDGIDQDCDVGGMCVFDGPYATAEADVQLYGVNASDFLGSAIAAGDFDGDGQDDLVAGMKGYNVTGASDAGAVALWYGPVASGSANTADLVVTGAGLSHNTGYDVAAADLDKDGRDDLVISAPGASSAAGAVYVLYGGMTSQGTQSMTGLTGPGGASFTGAASFDNLGTSVDAGADLDGDGYGELLLGAPLQDIPNASNAGAAHLVYGSPGRFSGARAISTADATFLGSQFADNLGQAVALLPDVDGDGLGEALVGSPSDNGGGTDMGAAYLFLGDTVRRSGASFASATADLVLRGQALFDQAGTAVASLGDLDGDGYGDYGVHGAGFDVGLASSAGALWVYRGAASPSATRVATVCGDLGSHFLGEEATSPGDLDQDGYDDLLVGAYGVDALLLLDTGAVHLYYGAISGTIPEAAADATFRGSLLSGQTAFGRRLAPGAHDVTGDGALDIITSAWLDDDSLLPLSLTDSGAIYIWTSSE